LGDLEEERVYEGHRKRLLDTIDDAVFFVPAAHVVARNSDTEFEFYQESNFHYLTGFDEPDSIAVLSRSGTKRRFILYVRPKDARAELWSGARLGPKGARQTLGADQAFPLSRFEKDLAKHIEGRANVVFPLGVGWRWEAPVLEKVSKLQAFGSRKGLPMTVRDLRSALGPVRCRKSAEEIRWIREAARVTGEAFAEAMAVVRPGVGEEQVRAVFDLVYGVHGGTWAFPTIAAGGSNACVLHYERGRDVLRQGELLLLDAGAEVGHYCADVTRTIPISGRFTPQQRRFYTIVLRALRAATDKARPGNKLEDVHDAATEAIAEGLARVGLLRGRTKTILSNKTYRNYFPHGTAHWLGLDVHDIGVYATASGSTVLEPGMVITVEPGIYVQPNDRRASLRLRGLGIRIEDDVLVTKGDPIVLTESIPRTIDEVEAAMARRPRYLKRMPRRRAQG
jgi:Xaa-Pro aminopeptidase